MARFELKRLTAGAFACFLLAACATDTGDTGVDAAEKKAFISQADAACKDANEAFVPLFETDFPVLAEGIPAFFAKASPIIRERADALKAVALPKDDARASEIVKLAEKSAVQFDKAAKDQAAGQKLFNEEGGKDEVNFRKKSKAYGLTHCSKDIGDDQSPSSKKLDPSKFSAEKKAYIEKGDAICKKADEDFKPIDEEIFKSFPPTLQSWADGIPKMIAIFGPTTQKLKDLKPPAGDEAAIKKIDDLHSEITAMLEQAGAAAKAGDAEKFQEIAVPLFEKFDESDKAERAYGFQVCGSEEE